MKKKVKGYAAIVILVLSLVLTVIWARNIVKLADCDFEAPYKAEVIYTIGIVAPPIGVVTGLLTIEDGKGGEK